MKSRGTGMFALFIKEWAPNGPPRWAVGPKKKPKAHRGPKNRAQSPAHSWVGLGWALGFMGSAEAYISLSVYTVNLNVSLCYCVFDKEVT